MSLELSRLGRLRIAIESGTSAFGVSQAASPSNFIDMPCMEGSVAPDMQEEFLDPQTLQTMVDDYATQVKTTRSTGLKFSTALCGTGTPLVGNTVLPTQANWAHNRLLRTVMGGVLAPSLAGAPTLVAAGSTTTTINVTSGHGGNFTRNSAIGVTVNGRVEAREILSISTDAISLKVALSAAPSTGAACYYPHTFYLTEDPQDSLQFLWDGMENGEKYCLAGMQGGFGIDMETGQIAKINVDLQGANWTKLGSSSIAAGTITNYSPAANIDSEFIVGTVGSTTRNLIHCTKESWNPSIKYLPVMSSSATYNNTLRMRRDRNRVIAGEFTTYFDSSAFDFYAAAASNTQLSMFRQIGSVAANGIVLLSAPTVQVMTPNKSNGDEISSLTVPWVGRNDRSGLGPTQGSYHSSAFKIHVF